MSLLFSFFGRIGRGGFWLGVLATLLVAAVAFGLIYFLVGSPMTAMNADGTPVVLGSPMPPDAKVTFNPVAMALAAVAYILVIWIGLATQVKRWHDRGASGWWVLINLIPLVGGIWSLVSLGFLEGQQGANKYGPDPRNSTA